jgi:hypothetical protein
MGYIIQVSAHQFKTKELASGEVSRIQRHRKDRADKILAPLDKINEPVKEAIANLSDANKSYEAARKDLIARVSANDKERIADPSVGKLDTVKAKARIDSEYKGLIKQLENNVVKAKKIAKPLAEKVLKKRGNYRHSKKSIEGEYKCINKCSINSQWVFQLQ